MTVMGQTQPNPVASTSDRLGIQERPLRVCDLGTPAKKLTSGAASVRDGAHASFYVLPIVQGA
jgi:hypothetical protein